MNPIKTLLLSAACVGLFAGAASAADIRVAPVTVDPLPGSRTSTLTLINEEQRPIQVQLRVMRWRQNGGVDELTPTDDVVASPPLTTLQPQQHFLVRLVRTGKAPLKGEESYRVLVDEVPDPANLKPGTVNLVLRQSIPVFFSDTPRRSARLEWSVDRQGTTLVARNTGNRRLRLSDLSLMDSAGGVLFARAGLNGYVLPGAEVRWPLDRSTGPVSTGPLKLTAQSDAGPVDVAVGPTS